MGAEVRIVNVWRVLCAQYPAVVLWVLSCCQVARPCSKRDQTLLGAPGFEVFLCCALCSLVVNSRTPNLVFQLCHWCWSRSVDKYVAGHCLFCGPCFAHVRSCIGFWWVTNKSPSRGFSVGELCTDLDTLSCHRFPETPLSQWRSALNQVSGVFSRGRDLVVSRPQGQMSSTC